VQHVADGVVFGGEGAGADAGGVGFGHADDFVDHPWGGTPEPVQAPPAVVLEEVT
jgi:hypothetical protein